MYLECTMHSWVIEGSGLAKAQSPGKWRQQHWQQPPRPAHQPPLAHLQSEAEGEVVDEVRDEAEVVEEAPQGALQPPQAELHCPKEQLHQEGLSYQRPMAKQKSLNKMDRSPQQTGRQLPLLMLQPLLLSPHPPQNQNLLLPQWKHHPLLQNLQQPQRLLLSLPLPLLLHLHLQ